MKYYINNKNLYQSKTYIGYVSYIDYRDRGRHGYGISKVKDYSLLEDFQAEARKLFPNVENPYIDYLDVLYSK